jgi:hypothetical protein
VEELKRGESPLGGLLPEFEEVKQKKNGERLDLHK